MLCIVNKNIIKMCSTQVQHYIKKHTNEDNIVHDKRIVGIHQVLALYAFFLYLWIILFENVNFNYKNLNIF